MCRTKGKPPKKEEAASKDTKKDKATYQADTKKTPQQVESAWGYPDGNWACQVDLEKKFELPGSINFIENKDPKLYTNDFSLDTRTRIQTLGLLRKGRKVTKNTVNNKAILAAVMLIMAGSTIKSTG